ncbi:MAG TPA: alpha/beta fold hydrolase [Pseudomonadales bacterium]
MPLLALLLLQACAGNRVFYPETGFRQTPADLGYQYRQRQLAAADGTPLSLWQVPASGESQGVILYFHGNARNLAGNLHQVLWLADAGYELVMMEYRGYGDSPAEADLAHSIDDIGRVLDWFVASYPQQPRFVLGQSLGAAMAGFALASSGSAGHFDGVVLDAAFAGYRRIMREVLARHWLTGLLRYPASLAMPAGYDLLPVIDRISPTPLLIMHGDNDRVVDYAHALDLYRAAAEPKQLLTYHQRHIQAFADASARQLLLLFLQQHGD